MKPRSARTGDSSGLESALADWARGAFKPVYLFAGEDTLRKEETLKKFQGHFFGKSSPEMNTDIFEGGTAAAGHILTAVRTFSLLGDRRLVLVKRAQDMPAAEINPLADGIPSLSGPNCLVLLLDEKAKETSVLVQAVKSAGSVMTFWMPFDNQLPAWVQERARSLGKSISTETAKTLVENVGPSLPDLLQELEKLSLQLKGKSTIDMADVESIQSDTRVLQYMELDRALWRRDRAKVLSLLETLRHQGQKSEGFPPRLAGIYRKLFLAKALISEKNSPDDVCNQFRIKSWQLKNEFLEALRSYTWDELLGCMEAVLEAERDFKTGRMEGDSGMTLLICRLTKTEEEAGLLR